jgi:hypothetical protein
MTSDESQSRKKSSYDDTDWSTASSDRSRSRRSRGDPSGRSQSTESAWTPESEEPKVSRSSQSRSRRSRSRDDPKSRTRTSRTTNDTRPDVTKGSESEKSLLPLSKMPLPPQSSLRSSLRRPAARFSGVDSEPSQSGQTGPTDSRATADGGRPPAGRSALTDPLLCCGAAILVGGPC